MKETVQKIVFFVLSMMLLFLVYRCSMMMKESKSPYVNFPNKIDTFR
jgi:L-asparagine transporter-like permease